MLNWTIIIDTRNIRRIGDESNSNYRENWVFPLKIWQHLSAQMKFYFVRKKTKVLGQFLFDFCCIFWKICRIFVNISKVQYCMYTNIPGNLFIGNISKWMILFLFSPFFGKSDEFHKYIQGTRQQKFFTHLWQKIWLDFFFPKFLIS